MKKIVSFSKVYFTIYFIVHVIVFPLLYVLDRVHLLHSSFVFDLIHFISSIIATIAIFIMLLDKIKS